VLENSDGVNAREIFASKCAEYSPTNETIGSNVFRYLPPAACGRTERGSNRRTIKNLSDLSSELLEVK